LVFNKDQLEPIADVNGEGSVRCLRIWGKGTSALLYDPQREKFAFVSDERGSVRMVIAMGSGSVVQELRYDVWGRVVFDSNPGFQPFGYAGGIYDDVTGLVRFGARDYDAEIGRWLSKEPMGFAGSLNWYVYVHNDPVNFIDPNGLWEMATEYGTTDKGLTNEMRSIENIVDLAHKQASGTNQDAAITFTTNGRHSAKSLHYKGNAVDIRTRHLSETQRADFSRRLRQALGSKYDVINEGDHIHCEYDPK
jgi:RHS repeat-associated protein